MIVAVAPSLVSVRESAVEFECDGDRLLGVLHHAGRPTTRGVVLVVGGPQYRVGSHRQFTLLARDLAQHGVPVLRFDYRGMGDSEGELRNFEGIAPDIHAAIDKLCIAADVREVVLWGLCDAASAIMLYAPSDPRVCGITILNPWVRTEAGLARAQIQHYYAGRLRQVEFWKKLLHGQISAIAAARSLAKNFSLMWSARFQAGNTMRSVEQADLPTRMAASWNRFSGRTLLILSGNDLTASEFIAAAKESSWQPGLSSARLTRKDLPEANHTFGRRQWRDQVADWTRDWIRSW